MGQYYRKQFVDVSVKLKGAHHEQDHKNSILPSGTSNCRKPHSYGSGRPGRPRGRGSSRNIRPRSSRNRSDNRSQYAASSASAHGSLRAAAGRSRICNPGSECPVCRHSPGSLFAAAAGRLRATASSPAAALVLPPSATASPAALASSATASPALAPSAGAPAPAACAPASPRWTSKTVNASAQTEKRSNPAGVRPLRFSRHP